MEGEGLEHCTTWSTTFPLWMSSHLLSTATVMYKTATLHSVLATKIGQALAESYTERIKHTQAKNHDCKGLLSDKYETNLQWQNHLVEWKDGTIWSCTTCIIAITKQLSFEPGYILQEGLTSPLELVSVILYGHKNKPLHLESVMSVVPWITW